MNLRYQHRIIMSRTGTLILLTTKLRHPNVSYATIHYDRSIACCLVNKRIPYICYLWISQERQIFYLGWRDVKYPNLQASYTQTKKAVMLSFNTTQVIFGSNDVHVQTPRCDFSMFLWPNHHDICFDFRWTESNLSSKEKYLLHDITRYQDLFYDKLKFATIVDKICVKYGF